MTLKNRLEKISYLREHPSVVEFLKFGIVGVAGTLVDFSSYALLTRVFGVYYIYATATSVFLAIVNNFFLNKFWTFKKGDSGKAKSESVKFFIVSLVNYFLNLGIVYIVVEHSGAVKYFGDNVDFFAKAVAIGIVLFSNYFGNKYWTFRN
ncbi:MAG: GtrA family protein [Patescibacteria group bacterium]